MKGAYLIDNKNKELCVGLESEKNTADLGLHDSIASRDRDGIREDD